MDLGPSPFIPLIPDQVTWCQETLAPPSTVEITLRIGVVSADMHAQVQAEIRQPKTGELLGMWSIHHFDVSLLRSVLEQTITEMFGWMDRNM